MMLERCLCFRAQKWDMTDDNTGERRQGTTLYYLSADYLDNAQSRGPQVFRESGPVELFDQVPILPGVYDVEFSTANKNDRNGRAMRTLKPQSATLVDEFDLGSLLQAETIAS